MVTATLAVMIFVLLVEPLAGWYGILLPPRETVLHEAPVRLAMLWAPGFPSSAHGDDLSLDAAHPAIICASLASPVLARPAGVVRRRSL